MVYRHSSLRGHPGNLSAQSFFCTPAPSNFPGARAKKFRLTLTAAAYKLPPMPSAKQDDLALTARTRDYLVRSGEQALCYVGARNSEQARQLAYHDARAREVDLKRRGESELARLDDFSPIRARAVADTPLELNEGEIICLTDAASVEQWWKTLHNMRLAAGSPRQPTFRHRATAVGRI